MSNLTEFLLARIAEDEATAREADGARLWRWSQHNNMIIDDSGHMQRFTPARILAECEARHSIVAAFEVREEQAHESNAIAAHATGLLIAMRFLALPYADHPDYRQEWKS